MTRTQLAPVLVERIARRCATQHRRASRMVLVVGILAAAGAIATLSPVLWVVGALFDSALLYVYRTNVAAATHALAIAETAATEPELVWKYEHGHIRGFIGEHPSERLLLGATPRHDETFGLPPARLL